MATNDFLTFGGAAGANVMTQASYAALAARTAGFSSGTANSPQLNKVWRQSSIIAAVIGQFIANRSGQDAVDDGTTSTLLANLEASIIALAGHGQCRLVAISATTIRLTPYDGNNLMINAVTRQIPSAGVSLSNSGMSANTLYYIYAYWTGSAIALEFSATGHSTGTNGVEIKTGDPSRTLVGMVYTSATSQFSDGPTARLVASWFNRRSVGAGLSTGGTLTFTATVSTEISTGVRINFLNWGGEAVDIKLTGQYTNSTSTQSVAVQSYVDSAPYGNLCGSYVVSGGAGAAYASTSSLKPDGSYLAEGFHTAQVYGSVTGNTGSSIQMSHSLITRI
ncbi:hypothetical protein ACIPZ5_01105 [Pseudomonas sp. NPDC089428]|uniref:hypothetical protein n=1 Tax=Pseudomonas sp. NPDC089428 TaxID=3364467 RepID=UPI00381F7D0E